MTDHNSKTNKKAQNSGDIADMLRMLRESVGKPVEAESNEKKSSDENDEALELLKEKVYASENQKENIENADFDAEQIEEEPEEIAEEDISDEEAEEIEEELDEDAPWYSDDESVEEVDEESEEIVEEDISDEEVEEELDEDAPWYSDDESVEEVDEESEEIIEEEISDEEAEESEEEFDEDAPWYSDDEPDEEIDEEPEEIVEEDISDEEVEEELDETYIEFEDEENVTEECEPPKEAENVAEISEENETVNDADANEEIIDKTDINLLSALGYTSATGDDGEELVRNVIEDERDASEEFAGDIAYDYEGGEFMLENQSDDILAGYKTSKSRILKRLLIAGACSFLLLIYEALVDFGVTLPWMFNQYEYPLSHIMISLQLLIICGAISAKNIIMGMYDLFCRRPTPYSVSAIIVTANILYTILIAIFLPESYMLFNFVGAFSVLLSVIYEYLLICHEERSFKVVSNDRDDFGYAFENDDCGMEMLGETAPSLRAYQTEFNQNYFSRTRKRPVGYKYLGILTLSVGVAAVLAFLISLIFTSDVEGALRLSIIIINFAMPLGVLATYSFPMFMASVKVLRSRGAVIGHAAADEYGNTRFVTFDEEDLFASLQTTHIDFKPSGELPIAEILRKTGLLFATIGGPMRRLVEIPEDEFDSSLCVIDGVFDDGISATVDSAEMLAGSAQFLEIHGIDVSSSEDARDRDRSNQILYVSINKELVARYYMKYRPDPDFIKTVNLLGNKGIAVGIRTRNPGVNSDIIAKRCPKMKYKVYAIKSGTKELDDLTSVRDITESGLYARGKSVYLAYPLIVSSELCNFYKYDIIVRAASAAFGALAVAVLAIFGKLGELTSLTSAVYQLVWIIPTVLASVFRFKKK